MAYYQLKINFDKHGRRNLYNKNDKAEWGNGRHMVMDHLSIYNEAVNPLTSI